MKSNIADQYIDREFPLCFSFRDYIHTLLKKIRINT